MVFLLWCFGGGGVFPFGGVLFVVVAV